MTSPFACKRCDYERKPSDKTSLFQCPSCGTAYSDGNAKLARSSQAGMPAKKSQPVVKQTSSAETLVAVSAGVVVFFGALFAALAVFLNVEAAQAAIGTAIQLSMYAPLFAIAGAAALLFGALGTGIVTAVLLWPRKNPPNPSIERTSPGKPGAASHVKRYTPR
jgi:hypothetical protein